MHLRPFEKTFHSSETFRSFIGQRQLLCMSSCFLKHSSMFRRASVCSRLAADQEAFAYKLPKRSTHSRALQLHWTLNTFTWRVWIFWNIVDMQNVRDAKNISENVWETNYNHKSTAAVITLRTLTVKPASMTAFLSAPPSGCLRTKLKKLYKS